MKLDCATRSLSSRWSRGWRRSRVLAAISQQAYLIHPGGAYIINGIHDRAVLRPGVCTHKDLLFRLVLEQIGDLTPEIRHGDLVLSQIHLVIPGDGHDY